MRKPKTKTAFVLIDSISLFCPVCGQPWDNPDSGGGVIQQGEFEELPKTLLCQLCDSKFRKPQVTFYRGEA